MTAKASYDALIIGSGPNGLAAAIVLAQKGLRVKVFESSTTIGGGTRTQELTLPGFHHDVCSAVHPMAVASPFLSKLPLHKHGLKWIYPEYPLAHPLDHQKAIILQMLIEKTALDLQEDCQAYLQLFNPFVEYWKDLAPELLAPFNPFPSKTFLMGKFGLKAIRSARSLAFSTFKTKRVRALLAGLCAHSFLPLETPVSAAAGLILAITGHAKGWPFPQGGAHQITKAMASYLKSIGGEIETGYFVKDIRRLPSSQTTFFDITPRQILDIATSALPKGYAKKLASYRYGSGVFKLDLALSAPIPWQDEQCSRAGTVHLGGSFNEIARSERAVAAGNHPEQPFILLAQPSLFDKTRAPQGKHTVWAYCHVPNSSTKDMTELIEKQIERFAPGFKKLIISKHQMNTADMQAYNNNYVGGDINGGVQDLSQFYTRPAGLFNPYHIPGTSLFICSSSTPPGGGVHGMCGYHAAQSALKKFFS